MSIVRMDTELGLELEQAYLLAAKKVRDTKEALAGALRHLPDIWDMQVFNGSGFNMSGSFLESLGELAEWLQKDAAEIKWRREWMERSDLFGAGHSFILEPSPIYSRYSLKQILGRLNNLIENFNELSREEFSALLFELARRGLGDPETAAEAIRQLGPEKYEQMFSFVYRDLSAELISGRKLEGAELEEKLGAHLLPLSILAASASWAKGGLDGWFQDSKHMNLRYLGMALGAARFSPRFLAGAGIHMLNKSNRPSVLAALRNNDLQLPLPPHRQPYRKLLNAGESAFKQLEEHPEGWLELLTHPGIASLKLDVDTLSLHRINFLPIFSRAMEHMSRAILEDPEIQQRLQPALPAIGAFIYRNQEQLAGSDSFFTSSAQVASHFIYDLRKMATSATLPLLAPILKDPEAMTIFSTHIGIATLRHLDQALDAEFDPSLTSTERERTISAHIDAVSDIYYHTFTAMAGSEKEMEQSISILASALAFVSRGLPQVLVGGLGVSPRLAVFGISHINQLLINHILKDAREYSPSSPRELFTRQLINRDLGAGSNGAYPEPTWFELELANKILEKNPAAREDLEIGKWFDGEKITRPATDQLIDQPENQLGENQLGAERELQDFAKWFSNQVNAEPPDEFSKSFLHTQRKFGNDLLLDVLSVEVEALKREAKSTRETAERALLNYEFNDYYDSYATESPGS